MRIISLSFAYQKRISESQLTFHRDLKTTKRSRLTNLRSLEEDVVDEEGRRGLRGGGRVQESRLSLLPQQLHPPVAGLLSACVTSSKGRSWTIESSSSASMER